MGRARLPSRDQRHAAAVARAPVGATTSKGDSADNVRLSRRVESLERTVEVLTQALGLARLVNPAEIARAVKMGGRMGVRAGEIIARPSGDKPVALVPDEPPVGDGEGGDAPSQATIGPGLPGPLAGLGATAGPARRRVPARLISKTDDAPSDDAAPADPPADKPSSVVDWKPEGTEVPAKREDSEPPKSEG